MTHIDLFSGIGGFALACRWCELETICFCERDLYCQKILAKHWPDVPIVSDIREFDGTRYTDVTILTGGPPCQPVSVAGERRGEADDRWLWPEMYRVITEARPRFVLFENVAGVRNMGLDEVLSDLEASGYATGAAIIPACAIQAQHRRDRCWVLADSIGERQSGSGSLGNAIHSATHQKGEAVKLGDGSVGQVWSVEPELGRVAHGVPNRMERLTALGNAIVPQLAYVLIQTLLNHQPSSSESAPQALANDLQ